MQQSLPWNTNYHEVCNITANYTLPPSTKVDFFWINRDQRSFEWFVSLLNQLEMEQSEQGGFDRFLDMHMYMTSALRKTDVKAIGLQMALDLIHKKQKRDLITGLKTKTQAGRPDWEKVYYYYYYLWVYLLKNTIDFAIKITGCLSGKIYSFMLCLQCK